MSNLIDRDALMARLEKNCRICKSKHMDREYGGCGFCGMTGAIGDVKRTPAVDAEPVRHERWIQPDRRKGYRCCSGCKNGGIWVDVPLPKFCGECGAKMDKEEQDG